MTMDCAAFCKALADGTRQQILEMLAEREEMCVHHIVAALDVSQPTISHHLKILKQARLVSSRKRGREVYYSINHDEVIECCGRLVAKFSPEEICKV
ncbi:MAG: metalloregulator ArsR/SmtB family transcription factor [Anaerolineae bacterium]|jgi:ArsR family transcriptional regulator